MPRRLERPTAWIDHHRRSIAGVRVPADHAAGDRLPDAQPGFDHQTNEAAVHLTLDSAGARIFKDVTRENVNKRMAILLIE